MEYAILAVMLFWGAVLLAVIVWQERRIGTLSKSNVELAQTLADVLRSERGVPVEQFRPSQAEVEAAVQSIYESPPSIAFPRAEWEDDPTLKEDPERLGEWDVPPGLLDAGGNEDMT